MSTENTDKRTKGDGWARTRQSSTAKNDARMTALIELLGDRSPTVWNTVRKELESIGSAARPALMKAARNAQPNLRVRARKVLLDQARLRVASRLLRWVERAAIDLERGLFLLGRLENPNLDPRPYQHALDAMAVEVRRRMASKPAGLARALVLAQYLGGELEYAGDAVEYDRSDNVFLHRAIERKKGMPLTLTVLYLCVARRAGIAAFPVPLPGHVMLRLAGGSQSVLVDPFHRGTVRTERDCLQYLAEHGLSFQPAWFRDADDSAMFQRQLRNLWGSYQRRGRKRDAHRLVPLLQALEARTNRTPLAHGTL